MRLNEAGREVAVALASGAYLSFIPARLFGSRRLTGAGLIGTLWGVAGLRWLPETFYNSVLSLLGFILISVVLCDIAEERLGRVDDPRIVMDEMVGFGVSMFLMPRTFLAILSGFVLFRLFDVGKWSLIQRAGDLPGGWGIVLDDVLAGLVTNGLLHVAEHLHPF